MNILSLLPILLVSTLNPSPTLELNFVDQEQAELRANLEKKLGEEFLESGVWKLDYNEARAQAAKSGKYLFVYFTRTFAP